MLLCEELIMIYVVTHKKWLKKIMIEPTLIVLPANPKMTNFSDPSNEDIDLLFSFLRENCPEEQVENLGIFDIWYWFRSILFCSYVIYRKILCYISWLTIVFFNIIWWVFWKTSTKLSKVRNCQFPNRWSNDCVYDVVIYFNVFVSVMCMYNTLTS